MINTRQLLASAAACALVALGVAWAPVTEHLADADLACGSLFSHTQGNNAVPATATGGGDVATATFDACPGSVYDSHETIVVALTGSSAMLTLLSTTMAFRRRQLQLRLHA